MPTAADVNDLAHIVQTAPTPVFLLSGIGTLLNVFNTRLARVSDHVEHAAELLEGADGAEEALLRTHTRRLQRRIVALDSAIGLGALGGAATRAAVFVLFLGSVRAAAVVTSGRPRARVRRTTTPQAPMTLSVPSLPPITATPA